MLVLKVVHGLTGKNVSNFLSSGNIDGPLELPRDQECYLQQDLEVFGRVALRNLRRCSQMQVSAFWHATRCYLFSLLF